MITIYRPTERTSGVQQFQIPRYSRAYEVASLALPIIREKGNERGRITRPQLLHSLREQYGTLGYAANEFSYVWTLASRVMEQQGLVAITEETLEQYLTGGRLTEQQIFNYHRWLIYAQIFEGHTRKNKEVYSPGEEDVFWKVGDYMDNEKPADDRMPAVEAVKTAVRVVLGQKNAMQFEAWYMGYLDQGATQQRESRRQKKVEGLQEDTPNFGEHIRHKTGYDAVMSLYDCIDAGVPLEIHNRVLDKLVQDYSGRYPKSMKNYPFGLYFALSVKKSESVLREKFDEVMQSTPTQAKFDDYEGTIFKSPVQSLEGISTRLVKYLDRSFGKSEGQIKTLEEQIEGLGGQEKQRTISRVGRMKRYLGVVKARYKDGTLKTLEELGGDRRKREGIRQLEAKGVELLREQPNIQELLDLDFWEI